MEIKNNPKKLSFLKDSNSFTDKKEAFVPKNYDGSKRIAS